MLEIIGGLDIDFDGKILIVSKRLKLTFQSSGELESMSENEKKSLIKNVIYVVQDINAIKNKESKLGNVIKIRIRNDKQHFEISVGINLIRINKYKPQ